MTTLAMMLCAALDLRWAGADTSIMTVNMPSSNNWQIGMTLDGMFRSGLPSPFTAASMQSFESAWEDLDEWDASGTFVMKTDIVSSLTDSVETMDIQGALEISWLMFSGDAHLSFAKDNIQCESDVSVIISASAAGRKKQLGLSDTNVLELEEDQMALLDLESFLKMYGSYVIVGFEYGGEILFKSTHSAKSSEDKMAIEGGLAVSFAKAGFKLAGSVDVAYEKSDISKSIKDSKDWSIRPNAWGEDANSLIAALSAISLGDMGDDPSLYETLAQSAQNVLSGEDAVTDPEPIKAILVPLSSVKAVHSQFGANSEHADTVPFVSFMNDIYMSVEGLSKQLELIEEQWRRSDKDGMPHQLLFDWDHRLHTLRVEMQTINNMNEIIERSAEYMSIYAGKSWNADVFQASSFIDITVRGLEYQFEEAVMAPYRVMVNDINSNVGDLYCSYTKGYAWQDVLKSDVLRDDEIGMDLRLSEDAQGKLIVEGTVRPGYEGCGLNPEDGSFFAVFIDDGAFVTPWERIRYTMEFEGASSCWSILGNTEKGAFQSGGVYTLGVDESEVNIINNNLRYGSWSGESSRADNVDANFFSGGHGKSGDKGWIRVEQGRDLSAAEAGFGVGLSCSITTVSTYMGVGDGTKVRFSDIQISRAMDDLNGASSARVFEANFDGDRRGVDLLRVHQDANELSKPKVAPGAVSAEWLTMGCIIALLVACIAGLLCFHGFVQMMPSISARFAQPKILIDDNTDEI